MRVKAFDATHMDFEIVNATFIPEGKPTYNDASPNAATGTFRINTTMRNITPILGYTNGVADK